MEKNDKKIMKYFSGMMNNDEKEKFEYDLKNDEGLHARFKNIEMELLKLENSQKGTDIDDRYFNSILPNVRAKIEKKPPLFFQPKFIYSAATIISVIILFFVLVPTSTNNDFALNNYEDELTEIINEGAAGEAIDDIFYDNYSYTLSENNFQQISEQVDLDLLNELKENNILSNNASLMQLDEPYDYIDEIDEQELNLILNELSEIKIL